jgi:hypothetical protein
MYKLIISQLILPFLFFLLTPIHYLLSPICYGYPDGWSNDILINQDTSGNQETPDVSTDSQNNVWITWDDATWTEGEIYYSKRDSLGNCLITETTVPNNPSKSFYARVRVDKSDNVHFVWRDESPQGYGIWYAKLANDGSVIVPSYLAVSGAGGLFSSLLPEIALNKYQEINVVWDEYPSGYNQMNYTKLDSLGDTMIPKIQVSPTDTSTCWPGISVDSSMNNHLGYRTDSSTVMLLTYTKLDRDGNVLVDNKTVGMGGLPTLISDRSQNIHIIYSDPTGPGNRIEYLKLDNDGNILIGPTTISPAQYSCTYCHMAMDSVQFLHVVWQADSFADVDIMYTKMDTAGNFIIPPMKVVYPEGGIEPRIAVDRSNCLHLVWVSARLGSPDIFYKRGENMAIKETDQQKVVGLPKITVFPNPFRQITEISFSVGRGAKGVGLRIYDVSGRLVRSFDPEGLRTVGQYDHTATGLSDHIIWDGTDNKGNLLASGVYFLWCDFPMMTQTIPIVLIK